MKFAFIWLYQHLQNQKSLVVISYLLEFARQTLGHIRNLHNECSCFLDKQKPFACMIYTPYAVFETVGKVVRV